MRIWGRAACALLALFLLRCFELNAQTQGHVEADLDGDSAAERVFLKVTPVLSVDANYWDSKQNLDLYIRVEREGQVVMSEKLRAPFKSVKIVSGPGDPQGREKEEYPDDLRPLLDGKEKVALKCEYEGEPTRYYALYYADGKYELRELTSLRGLKKVKLANGKKF